MNNGDKIPGVDKMKKDFTQARTDLGYLSQTFSQVKKNVDKIHYLSKKKHKPSSDNIAGILSKMCGI